jgi:hypothetical protein
MGTPTLDVPPASLDKVETKTRVGDGGGGVLTLSRSTYR